MLNAWSDGGYISKHKPLDNVVANGIASQNNYTDCHGQNPPAARETYESLEKERGLNKLNQGEALERPASCGALLFLYWKRLDCVHSFSEAGCGKDPNCENCRIKNAIVETFKTGESFNSVSTHLGIKQQSDLSKYLFQVSIEKIGQLALLRIDRTPKDTTQMGSVIFCNNSI